MNNYINKYKKYKTKYLELYNSVQIGSGGDEEKGGEKTKKIIFVRHGQSTENIALAAGVSYDHNSIVLSDTGKEQALKTGKYLQKTFGTFDKMYSSPATRCKQTSEIISKQICYDGELEISDLLVEYGFFNHKCAGLSREDTEKINNANKNLQKYKDEINQTQNPYTRLELVKKYNREMDIYIEMKPTILEQHENYKKFIQKLIESDYNNILVVCHVGTLRGMTALISKFDPENQFLVVVEPITPYFDKLQDSTKKYQNNCAIMCCNVIDGDIQMVSAANIKHLE